jgi:hypothetical protein
LITEIVNHGTDFDNLFERKTASQVAEILDNFLKGGGDEGGEVSEPASSDDAEDLDSAMKSLGV